MSPGGSQDPELMATALVEAIAFLDECADKDWAAPHEFEVEASVLRQQLAGLTDAGRTSLVHVIAAMYREAQRRSDLARADQLAGLYHEFIGTAA
jgi:hypothetical protein